MEKTTALPENPGELIGVAGHLMPPAPTAKQDREAAEEKINAAAQAELLGAKDTLAGLEFYPVTLASKMLLRSAKSLVLDGTPLSEMPSIEREMAVFLYVQSLDLLDDKVMDAVAKLVLDPAALTLAALKFARDLEGKIVQVVRFVYQMVGRADEMDVRVVARKAGTNTLETFHNALLPKA